MISGNELGFNRLDSRFRGNDGLKKRGNDGSKDAGTTVKKSAAFALRGDTNGGGRDGDGQRIRPKFGGLRVSRGR